MFSNSSLSNYGQTSLPLKVRSSFTHFVCHIVFQFVKRRKSKHNREKRPTKDYRGKREGERSVYSSRSREERI